MFALNRYNMMPWEFAELPPIKKGSLIGYIKATIKEEERSKKK